MSTHVFNIVLICIINNNCLGISWNTNPITFANETFVNQQPSGMFLDVDNNIYVAVRQNNHILTLKIVIKHQSNYSPIHK